MNNTNKIYLAIGFVLLTLLTTGLFSYIVINNSKNNEEISKLNNSVNSGSEDNSLKGENSDKNIEEIILQTEESNSEDVLTSQNKLNSNTEKIKPKELSQNLISYDGDEVTFTLEEDIFNKNEDEYYGNWDYEEEKKEPKYPEDKNIGTTIFAAGAYSGKELNKQIDDSGHNATQFNIYVNYSEKPVTLILGAYEPTIWNVAVAEGTDIKKIILGGLHRQVLAGINLDTLKVETYTDYEGDEDYFYIDESTLKSSLSRFGTVDKIYTKSTNSGNIIIGDENFVGVVWKKDKNNIPENYFVSDDELGGQAGLEMLVKKGFLRNSTEKDSEDWIEAIINNPTSYVYDKIDYPVTDKDDLETLKNTYSPNIYNGYTALKDFKIPAGLYGANSADFFIPKGIKYEGELGHSTLYDFNDLECEGSSCYMDY